MPQYALSEYWPPGLPGMNIVRTLADVEAMERFLVGRPHLIFDTETSGLDWYKDSMVCGSAFGSWDNDGAFQCFYMPFRHDTGEPQVSVPIAVDVTRRLLAQAPLVVAHNLKFDEHMGRREGWVIGDGRYDTMIASALFNENLGLKLELRAKHHLGRTDSMVWNSQVQVEVARLAKSLNMKKTQYLNHYGYSQVPINLLGIYACHDILYTGALYSFFEGTHSVSKTYPRIWPTEMALTRVLCEMEANGLPVDVPYVESLREALFVAKEGYSRKIRTELGPRFNPGSDEEVRRLIYEVYRNPITRWTKGRKASVDSDILAEFSPRIPILKVLQEWRDAEKLLNTYTTSILKRMGPDNVCHTDFQQVGANTGRMASRSPNFQNMPTDDADRVKKYGGKDPWSIRRAFIARSAKEPRLFFDYSQVELRVIAHFTQDPIMCDVFLSGGDLHKRTQDEVGLVLGRAIPRRQAKVVNFGISYGLTIKGLSRQAGMPEAEAEMFLKAFEERYAGIPQFRERFWDQIRATRGHWFANLWGRRRRLPNMSSDKDWECHRAERQAIGTLIQGQAAELTKESLVRVDRFIKERGLPVKLCNVVHDDIQMDCPIEVLTETCLGVKAEMERYPEFAPIPIIVDGDYTVTNWAEKHSLPLG